MLRGPSLRDDGPAVLIVDEASRVRDELFGDDSPMLAAAPAKQIVSRPRPAPAAVPPRLVLDRDWERVQIAADQCPRIFAAHLPPSASALVTLSTARSIRAFVSRRAASSTPRLWRACSGMKPRTGPTSPPP